MSDLVLYENDFRDLKEVVARLRERALAKFVVLMDKAGQQIATIGDSDLSVDPTSLASLTAGNAAATDGLAKLLGEKEFSILFHEGARDNLHISVVKGRVILVVIFDERSSLGRVRREEQIAARELEQIFGFLDRRGPDDDGGMPSPVPRSGGGPAPAPMSARVPLPRGRRGK